MRTYSNDNNSRSKIKPELFSGLLKYLVIARAQICKYLYHRIGVHAHFVGLVPELYVEGVSRFVEVIGTTRLEFYMK